MLPLFFLTFWATNLWPIQVHCKDLDLLPKTDIEAKKDSSEVELPPQIDTERKPAAAEKNLEVNVVPSKELIQDFKDNDFNIRRTFDGIKDLHNPPVEAGFRMRF